MPRLRSPAAAAALVLAAASAPLAAQPGADGHRVYDARGARFVTFAEMTAGLREYDVVFVGEQHDDPVTHRLEAALLEQVGRGRRHLLVGLEMFERDVQVPLDEYGAGRVAESAFLASARPWPNYAGDYRPLVELARARGWPVVASNVPRRMASAIARGGHAGLDTVPPAEWRLMAAERGCPPEGEYFRRFGEVMSGGASHGADA